MYFFPVGLVVARRGLVPTARGQPRFGPGPQEVCIVADGRITRRRQTSSMWTTREL
ncbi:hypothetical protein HMPREF9056_01950 [Actinomyces sp. oral taxon 170 str. F0386]|nr:hypothetical protein HMPREF9056_01950 [Actinomyces sp. oral taxon 170 str. F0386]